MARKKKTVRLKKRAILPTILFRSGIVLVVAGISILVLTFAPLLINEGKYLIRQWAPHPATNNSNGKPKAMQPIDPNFDIIIPKLEANARIIPNVNPFDVTVYQAALTRGVAHADGTAYPGSMGNVFLFAHSSENFYDALKYNSIFYLINKLETGDEIYLFYNKVKFVYTVTGKKFVDPKDVSYLSTDSGKPMLTLMTCWPPGTAFQRLLVFADLKK